MDGWYCKDDRSRSSSSSGTLPRCLLDSYELFFGRNDNSIASEFEDSGILNSISVQLQQQLCEQTTTPFVGRESETIEFGMSAFRNIYAKMDMEKLFCEESVKQSEFFPSEQLHPSSSSSSQRSLTNSPEYSSFLKNTSFPILDKVPYYGGAPSYTATVQPYLSSIHASDQYRNIKFPTMKTEDMIITSALSAIISSNSTITTTTISDQPIRKVQANGSQGTCDSGFKPYNSSIPPKFEPRKKSCGQKIIKDSIAYLRKVNLMRGEAANQGLQPTRHQLHHMISERKRREKLNESFYELRLLLPPCSKKDKASVLYKTKDYLRTLEAQIFELEKKNQMLEINLVPTDGIKDVGRLMCSKNIQIVDAFEPMIAIKRINLKITVRLQCDLVELVLRALEYLKEIRAISLVSLDANTYLQQMVQFTWATLKFDIKASDWDEISFKKGMTRAVDIATM